MIAAAVKPIRVVSCRNCGMSVRIPKKILERDASLSYSQEPSLESKAFAVRCRACQKESIYTLDEIGDVRDD